MTHERVRILPLLRATAWLRWRLTLNGLRGGARRDGLERFSRVAGLVAVVVMAIAVVPVAAFFGGLAAWGGFKVGRDVSAIGPIFEVFQAFLAFSLVAVLAGPIVRLSQGTQNLARLLLLPLPRRWFHVAEVASWLVDPFVLLVAPALAMFPLGLLVAGRVGGSAVVAIASLLFLVALAALGATLGFAVQLWFRDRRRGEILTVIAVLTFGLVAFLPSYRTQERRSRPPGAKREVRVARAAGWPAWTQPLPNLLWARAAKGAVAGETGEVALGLGGLATGAGALLAASGIACARILDTPAGGASRGRSRRRGMAPRLPGLSPAASAVAWTQGRTWLRTVRGRINAIFPPLSVLLFSRLLDDFSGHAFVGMAGGPLLLLGAAFFSLLGLQPLIANCFATDRSGLALQFLSPIDDRELATGKAVGCALVYAATVAFSALVAGAVDGGRAGVWIAVGCIAVGAFLLVAPTAIALSALFPRTADLNKLNAAGNPNLLGATLVSLASCAAFAIPVVAAGIAAWSSRQPMVAAAVGAGFLLLAALAHRPLLRVAARAAGARRENLALVATGR